MSNKVVVDANVIVALLDVRDVHHDRTLKLINRLEDEQKDLVLMDCILNEVYTVLARRSLERGYRLSEIVSKVKNDLESFEIIEAYLLVNRIHDKVIELMTKTDGRLNYHDALICLVMKEKGINKIATFDKDFKEINWLEVEDRS
jgi:hypothetical protein